MSGQKARKNTNAFAPKVSGLEERNLLSVAGAHAPARIHMAQVGTIKAANSHPAPKAMPLSVLAGTWQNTTWITKAFSDMNPNLPSTFTSVDVNEHIGNSIVSTESAGGMQVNWSITRTHRGLTLTVENPSGGESIVMPGRRVGPVTYVFQGTANVPGATEIRSVFSIVNHNTYTFSNFAISTGTASPRATLLYASMNVRLPDAPNAVG